MRESGPQKSAQKIPRSPLLTIMPLSQLSAAVVVVAVVIAAIGLGITADDAGAESKPKSRLFVVSSVLARNTAHGQHKTNILFFFHLTPLFAKGDVICAH